MPYNVTDKTIPFSIAYGVHNLHSGNGKLVRYRPDVEGSALRITAQLALGRGVLHAVKKLVYDGQDIDSSNYHFFKGAAGETAADAYFPDDINHPGYSFINYKLPAEMSAEEAPDKAIVQLECREVADYNASGAETGFGYSANPARCAADLIKIVTNSVSIIEFSSWIEWRDACSALIPVTKDGETISVPRFRLDAFFTPPFTLKEALNRICQLTCSDWQWRAGKIRFIPPTLSASAGTFDLSKVSRFFEFEALNAKNMYNGVIASWRNLDDPILAEADPIIVDRRISQYAPKNFYQLNLGNCYRDQGERVANFWAKIYCDLKDYASVRASRATYKYLPGDVIDLTHPTADWTNKRCRIVKKTEREDRASKEGIETDEGYQYYVRVEPSNPYSDTDFTPIVTREAGTAVSRYAAPPTPSLSFAQVPYTGRNGQIEKQLVITVQFGDFGFEQRGKVFWARPGQSYAYVGDLTPGANNQSSYTIPNAPTGDNYIRVVAYSNLGRANTGMNDALIVIGSLNTETGTPAIEKIGLSTPESVVIGVKGYTEKMRFRKIETANNSGFSSGYTSVTKDYHDVINNNNAAIEAITGTDGATKYVRVSHSTNNIDFSPVSGYLQIHFFNESNDGVPTLIDNVDNLGNLKIFDVVGDSWKVPILQAAINGFGADKAQYRFLDDTNFKTVVTDHGYYITLNNTSGFPASGKIYASTGEILSFGGLNGNDIISLTRGIEGTAQTNLANGAQMLLVILSGEILSTELYLPRLDVDVIGHYRRRNANGWSDWRLAGRGLGKASTPTPPPPTPPPAVEINPITLVPGYEDPDDLVNDKRRYNDLLLLDS